MAIGHKRWQEVKKMSPIQQGVEVTVCLRYSAPHPWLCISMRWSNQVIAITIWTEKNVTMMMMMMMMLVWPWQKTCGWCTSAWDCRPPQIPAIFEFYKFCSDLEKTSTKVNKSNTTEICRDLVETNTKGRYDNLVDWLREKRGELLVVENFQVTTCKRGLVKFVAITIMEMI